MVIKIYDPRYLDDRITKESLSPPSHPWNFANEQAAVMARPQNSELSDEQLINKIYFVGPEDLSGEDLAILWEERYYRLLMNSYAVELSAYERLKDLQGSAIPRLIMAGEFLPPDKRAIQPPALVLEYIPSVSLHDVSLTAITPALCKQLVSTIESFPSHGVIHNDITFTNIHFTPPERPEKVFVIDFGCSIIRSEEYDEEHWTELGVFDVRRGRRLLEDKDLRKSDAPASRFRLDFSV